MTIKRRDILIAILVVLLAWHVLSVVVNKPILPTPLAVGAIFIEELNKGLLEHFLVSLWRVVASTALAIAIAVPVGLLLRTIKKAEFPFFPTDLPSLPNPESRIRSHRAAFLWFGRLSQNLDYFYDPLLSNIGLGA